MGGGGWRHAPDQRIPLCPPPPPPPVLISLRPNVGRAWFPTIFPLLQTTAGSNGFVQANPFSDPHPGTLFFRGGGGGLEPPPCVTFRRVVAPLRGPG